MCWDGRWAVAIWQRDPVGVVRPWDSKSCLQPLRFMNYVSCRPFKLCKTRSFNLFECDSSIGEAIQIHLMEEMTQTFIFCLSFTVQVIKWLVFNSLSYWNCRLLNDLSTCFKICFKCLLDGCNQKWYVFWWYLSKRVFKYLKYLCI